MSGNGEADLLIDREELSSTARRVMSSEHSRRALLYGEAPQRNAAFWQSITELGWAMMTVPAAHGGLEQPFPALATMYYEMGRALTSSGYMASMLAVEALTDTDLDVAPSLLAATGTGELQWSFPALATGDRLLASCQGNRTMVSGVIDIAHNAEAATHLLTSIDINRQVAWAIVDLTAKAVTKSSAPVWDLSRSLGSIRIAADAPIEALVLEVPVTTTALDRRIETHHDLAVAWDSIGGADGILELTVQYARDRRQFGRPIGSFQALKHRFADMKTWVEAARALTIAATDRFSGVLDAACWIAAQEARLFAAEVYRKIAIEAVQLHGGIGFTWEHECHLFLKRALLNEQLRGSPAMRRDRLARTLVENGLFNRDSPESPA